MSQLTETKQRNRQISCSILSGASVSKVAKEFNLSATCCGQIVRKFCLTHNKKMYLVLENKTFSRDVTIRELRKHTSAFFDTKKHDDLSIYTPIHEVDTFPEYMVNALEASGVNMVKELFSTDLGMLKKYAGIGDVALKIIKQFLNNNDHLTKQLFEE